jgi:trehalose synthase
MGPLIEVPVTPRAPDRLEPGLAVEQQRRLRDVTMRLHDRLAGRVVWNVSSSSTAGGVPEWLRSMVAHGRRVGIDVRWVAIQGPREFFVLNKELHRALQGAPEKRGALDTSGRILYEEVLHENAVELATLIRRSDIVLLHGPQTAGLIPHALRAGARVIWRCPIGAERPNDHAERAWRFLAPYLDEAQGYVFTRKAFVPSVCDTARTEVIPPTIDPLSPKNQELAHESVRAILVHAGLVQGPAGPGSREFTRGDGSPGRVDRCADVIRLGSAPAPETPLIVQIARWDPLKDPAGVLTGFATLMDGVASGAAELVLAGPTVHAVADDPDGPGVFDEVARSWRALPHAERRRIHLVNLPMTDVEENAAIVNALQRHALAVVQKSLLDGFALTVWEAMWKGRAVVASAVGGIADQIQHEETGLLVQDPRDLDGFGQALRRILEGPTLASRLGRAARDRVREHLLGVRSLERWYSLLERFDS